MTAAGAPAFRAALDGLELVDHPVQLRLRSRDFYWYSPILKRELDGKAADLIVVPHTIDEVVRVAAACARFSVPLVVRGGATGNYGQMVPLQGGVLLDMAKLDRMLWIDRDRGRFEAGVRLGDADQLCQQQGWELRMFPSTRRQATVGGYVCGGAAGVGSIRYGQLRDAGSVLGMKVVTCEPTPRVVELRGPDIGKALHAYGTTCIVVEVELALAPAYPWVEVVAAFDDFAVAAPFAQALGEADGIFLKLDSLMAWPLPRYFRGLDEALPQRKHVVMIMVAAANITAVHSLVRERGGTVTLERRYAEGNGAPPLYEYTWNHTTLQALKVDKAVTYLQTVFPLGANVEALIASHEMFGEEVMAHAEFQRRQGRTNCSSLQVVRYTSDERLWEIVRGMDSLGIRLSNPHSYILEDKGARVLSADLQLAFKREADPQGLLNPGKDEPMDGGVKDIDWPKVAADLAPIECIVDPALVRQKSRDFFWYSPVLNEKLKGVRGDLVVCPASEDEVVRTLAYCHAHRIAVTPRGAGTGNYGQAMPLQGGIVLDLSRLDRFLWLKDGVARMQAGLKLIDLEAKSLPQGWELRFHPSTRRTATIGGFIAGGSGGVGSVQFGGLRNRGNVLGLRVITMEAKPRVLELGGDDVMPAVHAYGTNGIITELELPLARAWPWQETLVAFADIGRAAVFGNALGEADGIIKKLITAFDWSTAQYFKPLLPHMPQGQAIVLSMIADSSREPFAALAAEMGGTMVFERPYGSETDDIPPLYEFTWNHTTLWALKTDRSITYLQCLFNGPDYLDKIARTIATFGDETPMHLEFTRFDGHVAAFGLQLVRFTSEQRLYEIIGWLEANGVPVADPHTFILEDGGMKTVDEAQLAFKRQNDPQGLLNPGKMKAWQA